VNKQVNPNITTKEEKFWARVDKSSPNGCWLWTGSKYPLGYGHLRWEGKSSYAHRIAWMLANRREIPKNMCICHRCDNPQCVRPDHLFLGTYAENSQDRERKGRGNRPTGKGSHSGGLTTCKEAGCDREASKVGYCNKHYMRILRSQGKCRWWTK
jgi:hypothetical protein